jgi:hypothetical protein
LSTLKPTASGLTEGITSLAPPRQARKEESVEPREFRRMAGMLAARLVDLKLRLIEDHRSRRGKRWKLEVVVRTVLVGLMAGCKSVAEIEALTERMSGAMRRQLGITRRLPDTTAREVLTRLDIYDVRQALFHCIRAASWRGALACDAGLPFHVVALDGKATSIDNWDHGYAQQKTYDDGRQAHGTVRTVTACLQSAAPKPVIDCFPIPAETNEMGIFAHAFESLLRKYPNLFQLITYDAGVPSEENCQTVVAAGKDFFFNIKNENWHLVREAQRLLGGRLPENAAASTQDVLAKESQRWSSARSTSSRHRDSPSCGSRCRHSCE